MFVILLILFIIETVAFCYLFYKILEIEKDIDTLYDNYSKALENSFKTRIEKRGNMLK